MAQDKSKRTETDPMLEGTGQPGELANTPTTPDSTFVQEMNMEEQGIEQDPALEGTGQPGELYGAPTEPSEEEMKYDEAKREASKKIAPMFSGMFWLRSISPDIELKPYSPSVMAKKIEEA